MKQHERQPNERSFAKILFLAQLLALVKLSDTKTQAQTMSKEDAGAGEATKVVAETSGEERGIVYRLQKDGISGVVGIKRFAGWYCKHCEVSLLREGEQVAWSKQKEYADACPLCDVSLHDGIESGRFVRVSCFEWRMEPHRLRQRLVSDHSVVDSYGGTRSIDEFLNRDVAFCACPIQFYHTIQS